MKIAFVALLAALSTGVANAQPALWQQPSPVQENRELPRTQTISYDSEQNALLRSHTASLYLQPLATWTTSEQDNGATVVYSTTYKVPFKWVDRQLFLYVGGANSAYEVAVNGKPAGYNQSGRTVAEFDLTRLSKEGNNTLTITVYGNAASRKLENHTADLHPRLTGETYIVAQPKMRIRDYVARMGFEGTTGNLELGVIFKSHLLNEKMIRMYYTLYDPTGEQVAKGNRDVEINMRREDTVRFFIPLPDVKAWNHETPNLYTLSLKTQYEGRFMEYVTYKIGFRTVEMQQGKLLINGRDIPMLVTAYTSDSDSAAMASELQTMKEKGVNTIQVNNHPLSDRFYELCDRLGLYVCNQADIDTHLSGNDRRKGGTPSNDPAWEAAYIDRVTGMYYTSRNHPSATLFSLAQNSANGYNLYESYLALKDIEPRRPIIYTGAGGEWNTDAVSGELRRNNARAASSRITFGLSPIDNIRPAQLFDITAPAPDKGVFRLHNLYQLTALENAEAVYTVRVGRRVVSEGRIPVSIGARGSADITVPFGKAKPGSHPTVELVLECSAPGPYDYIPQIITEERPRGPLGLLSELREKNTGSVQASPKVELIRRSFSTTF